jgi:protein required for attachment to host cells
MLTKADGANQIAARAFNLGIKGESAMKAKVTWIVIADGNQAKVFEHDGPGKGLRAFKELNFEQEPLKASEIMADKPGRSFTSAGPGARSSMEYSTDPVQERERKFVEKLAEVLNQKKQEGKFDRLVIAAAPAALGDIRPALSDQVKDTILAEMPKDLTNVPTANLAAHFDGLIAV